MALKRTMITDPRIQINRIKKFLNDNAYSYYEDGVNLDVYYTLDDNPISFDSLSSRKWTAIKQGQIWGKLWQSAWFRFSGIIPSGWGNEEIVALIDTGSEACLFDSKGNPVLGLTSKANVSEPMYRKAIIPLSGKVRNNGKILLLVEAAANSITGIQREAVLNEAGIKLFRRDRWDIFHDIFFLFDLALGLPENSVRRAKILYKINKALNFYNDGSREDTVMVKELLLPELKKPACPSSPLVSAVGHAHLDIAWKWPLMETIRKAGRTFSSALFYMDEYPEYKFGASQPQNYQFVKDNYPELFSRIKKAVSEGRWELQGGMWVEPDCNLSGGESLIRQIYYGKRFFKDEFGEEVDNLWLPDTFGFSPVLPQLMLKSGIKYLMSQKLGWNKINKFPYHSFLWEGTDGSRVFCHFLAADSINSTMHPSELIFGMDNFHEKDRSDRWLYIFGEGDGGGGPGRHHLELAHRVKNSEGLPRVTIEAAKDFFKKAEEEIENPPEWRGELYLEAHRGTFTTRGKIKQYNRTAEYLLHNIEFLLVISRIFMNTEYPEKELERLWKILLLNQFHDILPGTTINRAYIDSIEQFKELFKKSKEILNRLSESLANPVNRNSESGETYMLFNTTCFIRKQIIPLTFPQLINDCTVTDEKGQLIPSQQSRDKIYLDYVLPSYGFKVIRIKKGKSHSRARNDYTVSGRHLENSKLKITFMEDGTIGSIFDKEFSREIIVPGERANRFILYRDMPPEYDAWDIDSFYTESQMIESVLVTSGKNEEGLLCSSIIQERIISKSTITQEILIYKDSRVIEFKTTIDWHEDHKMLKVSFPVDIYSQAVDYDIQFGNIKRPNYRNTSWDKARLEVFAHKWADLSDGGYGVALINNAKYGYNVNKNIMELTLLRSPTDPDPSADREVHNFSYALMPHSGDFRKGRVVPEGYFFNIDPVVIKANGRNIPGSFMFAKESYDFFSVDSDNVVIETIKKAEKLDALVIRVYETFGISSKVMIKTLIPVKNVKEIDLMENEINRLSFEKEGSYSEFTFKIKPYEIKTFMLDY
ncbi:MAG: alpha-mannosidase [Spirochaetes bacterium]|nr:alpha-mannosidase [Spirochaetota bacterium]